VGVWQRAWHRWSRQIGIDLGTANTVVHVRGRGIVLREPSVVVIDRESGEVMAAGAEARQMLGKTPPGIAPVRPLKDGVIADFEIAEAMLREFLRRVHRRRALIPGAAAIAVPSGVTQVEQRAVRDAALRAGVREARLIEGTLAAALGAGLPVWDASGSMIVDIGGGTSEVAVIALNGVAAGRAIRVAGDEMDEGIASYLQQEFSLEVGIAAAERVKLEIGSACSVDGDERATVVRGRDVVSGLPKAVEVSSAQVREAIGPAATQIAETVVATLEETPPELAGDIMQRGITLTGGGALLHGMDRLIQRVAGMPVRVADDPLACVALGAGQALERLAEVFVAL
jgi:rod shape-determining protein MreB